MGSLTDGLERHPRVGLGHSGQLVLHLVEPLGSIDLVLSALAGTGAGLMQFLCTRSMVRCLEEQAADRG